jgi:hypothetical protein
MNKVNRIIIILILLNYQNYIIIIFDIFILNDILHIICPYYEDKYKINYDEIYIHGYKNEDRKYRIW